MASKLCLSSDTINAQDCSIVKGADPVGDNLTLTIKSLDRTGKDVKEGITKAILFLKEHPTAAVHIFGSSIQIVNDAAQMIASNTTYQVGIATSKISKDDRLVLAQHW